MNLNTCTIDTPLKNVFNLCALCACWLCCVGVEIGTSIVFSFKYFVTIMRLNLFQKCGFYGAYKRGQD